MNRSHAPITCTAQVWPWSFDECDRKLQKQQRISACSRANHYDMENFHGRGAPEVTRDPHV